MKTTCTHVLGIAIIEASGVGTDLVSSSQLTDYSFIIQPFSFDEFNAILRCVTGLGPSGSEINPSLGEWYFNGLMLPFQDDCLGPEILEARGARVRNFPGVINLYLCFSFTTTEEGIYECRMRNSSMIEETMRVGVYIGGRSE